MIPLQLGMLCPSCEINVLDDARFCASCGASLEILDDLDSPTIVSPAPVVSGAPKGLATSGPGVGRLAPTDQDRAGVQMGDILAERYRIIGRIGSGGMGDVYRADDLKLNQPVALKFLPQKLAQDPDRRSRLLSEVRLARKVAHRNVCRVHDITEHEGVQFLSMEFIDGDDLGSLLHRIGKFSEDKAVEIARQLCAGLHAAHEQGILHRNLTPANILVDNHGVAHIADFGLAGIESQISQREVRVGTPGYMAPEQLAGKEVTIQSDLFALGLILHQMFTGRPATNARSIAELSQQQSTLGPQSSTKLSSLDPIIERAISRCIDPDPAMRPASALALAASLPGGDPVAAALAAGSRLRARPAPFRGGSESSPSWP